MTDDLEFSISQYVDGTLDESKRPALEARLASDAEARRMLEGHRALNSLLRAHAAPQVQGDKLREAIWDAIDQELENRTAKVSWLIRLRNPRVLAAVASVLLAAALAIHFLTQGHPTQSISQRETTHVEPIAPAVAMLIEGPSEDQPAGPHVEEVSIGPGGNFTKNSSPSPYADDLETRPTRVLIAAAGAPAEAEESQQPSPF